MTTKDQLNYDKNASPLSEEEMKSAVPELTNAFRKVTRDKVDPTDNYKFMNVSFMFLKEPHDGIYGFFKPRGVYMSEEEAALGAEKTIKYVDSCFIIHTAHMGRWNPITNNKKYSNNQMDVKTEQDEITLRDRALHQESLKNRELKRELDERKEMLKTQSVKSEDLSPDSLEYYTKLFVGIKETQAYIKQGEQKLERLRKTVYERLNTLVELNKRHPEYEKEWLNLYNKEREKVGLTPVTEQELDKPNILGQLE